MATQPLPGTADTACVEAYDAASSAMSRGKWTNAHCNVFDLCSVQGNQYAQSSATYLLGLPLETCRALSLPSLPTATTPIIVLRHTRTANTVLTGNAHGVGVIRSTTLASLRTTMHPRDPRLRRWHNTKVANILFRPSPMLMTCGLGTTNVRMTRSALEPNS